MILVEIFVKCVCCFLSSKRLESQADEETKILRNRLTDLSEENKQLKSKIAQSVKEKQAAERKIAQQASK